MSDKLEALIQTAVRLDVEIFCVLVRDVKQLLRVAVYRTAVVDFELNAEMPQTFSVEHKVGRIAVFMDNVTVFIPAGRAISVVITVPVRAVAVDNTPTVIAANIVLIKAVIAEYVRVILDGIFLINPFVAVGADYGQPVGAILAEPVILYLEHFVNRMLRTTVCTNSCFTHWLVLHFVWLISILFGKQHSGMR